MTLDTHLRCFPGLDVEHQDQVLQQFRLLDNISEGFYAIIVEEQGKYKFDYASPSIEILTGYPMADFSYHGGSPFFYSITPPPHRKLVLEQEIAWLKKARKTTPATKKPFIIEIHGGLQHASNKIMDVRLSALVVGFTAQRIPKLAINVWQVVDGFDKHATDDLRRDVEKILTCIWQFCDGTQLYPDAKPVIDDPIRLSNPLYEHELLTKREFNVLRLLANGLSTSAISKELQISDNTTETYRRHLLEKFRAVNAAEMIKKASKVYWLE